MRSSTVLGGLVVLLSIGLSLAGAQGQAAKGGAPGPDSGQVEKAAAKKPAPTTRPASKSKGMSDADDADDAGDAGADVEEPKVLVPADKIKSLTDEQMIKLREIAARAEQEKEAIMKKARDESFALLTEEQKGELAAYKQKAQEAAAQRKLEAQKKREAKLKAREERAKLKGEKKKAASEQGK